MHPSWSKHFYCIKMKIPFLGMAAAANFAWVNRSSMTFLARQSFAKMFKMDPDDLDMHVIYDVSHNIAKFEEHTGINFDESGRQRIFLQKVIFNLLKKL